MKPILIVYATREGHSQVIAARVGITLRAHGASTELVSAANPPKLDFDGYGAVIVVAPIHMRRHPRELVRFLRQHNAALTNLRSALISSSLTQAGAEDPRQSEQARKQARRAVRQIIEQLFAEADWRADVAFPVAGALLYTRYNPLVRFVMKRISKSNGGSTDTSRDHVYTDWNALDRFIVELLAKLQLGAGTGQAA